MGIYRLNWLNTHTHKKKKLHSKLTSTHEPPPPNLGWRFREHSPFRGWRGWREPCYQPEDLGKKKKKKAQNLGHSTEMTQLTEAKLGPFMIEIPPPVAPNTFQPLAACLSNSPIWGFEKIRHAYPFSTTIAPHNRTPKTSHRPKQPTLSSLTVAPSLAATSLCQTRIASVCP